MERSLNIIVNLGTTCTLDTVIRPEHLRKGCVWVVRMRDGMQSERLKSVRGCERRVLRRVKILS